MATTVHGGSLGRWFEKLCRITYPRLREKVVADGSRLIPRAFPRRGGVYVFWWNGSTDLLKLRACNRKLCLVGPGGRAIHLSIDDEWLGLPTKLPIPMYVGKTASDIRERVAQHLMLGKRRILPRGRGARKAKAPTTSCQLRAGIEHLFPSEKDTRALVLDNVGLSFVELHGDHYAANRFYLEDLAIGLMRPPLNVDVER